MPQLKKLPTARDGAPAAIASDGEPNGVRDHLTRLLNPLDVALVTRERLQEVVDDAIQRGRMTHSDAADLVAEIFARSRRTTEELISDVDQLLGGTSGRVRREVDRARRATGLAPFPIAGYESLSAAQAQARLGDLSAADLRRVREFERHNANRKTVLAAVESRLGAA
jgi:hypothetical protein